MSLIDCCRLLARLFGGNSTIKPITLNDSDLRASDLVLEHLRNWNASTGVAIQLGCTSADNALLLLEWEWTVIVVDPSQATLNLLAHAAENRNTTWEALGQLTFVHSEIEKYEFAPEKGQCMFVLVENSTVERVQYLLQRAFSFLGAGGHCAMSVRSTGAISPLEWIRNEMGEIGYCVLGIRSTVVESIDTNGNERIEEEIELVGERRS
jgi:hypothetical protein